MIYWNGCSFVQGMEVEQRKDQFPYLVGSHFKQDTWRNSKVGGSNDRIWRTTMDDMTRTPMPLVVILWSGPNRFEFLNLSTNIWRSAVWVSHRFNRATLKLTDDSEVHFHPDLSLKQWQGLNGYAKEVRNPKMNLIYTLHYMMSTKHFLEAKGIPYLFYTMSSGQLTNMLDYLDEDRLEGANIVWEVPHMKKEDYIRELPCLEEEPFYDMCKKAKVPFGPRDHPLEEGHKLMANRIIGDIYKYELGKLFSK